MQINVFFIAQQWSQLPLGVGFFNEGLYLSDPILFTTIHEAVQSQAREDRGWSPALKQGVVLKLARSVVVPWGLNWLEWALAHT